MATQEKPSIAIVGGGLAGLTLSIGLSRHGIPHKIYESASKFAEIGAGIAMGPNSIAALELIDPRIKDVLKKCVTYNTGIDEKGQGEGKEEWLDVRVGESEDFGKLVTTIRHEGSSESGKAVRACSHRARFLDELNKLIPPSTALFNKSLTVISSDPGSELLTLNFADGTTATASAVIACDGIKSVARHQYVLADVEDRSVLQPTSASEVAYRGVFPRAQFKEITGGAIDPGKMTLFCGPDSYVVMYSIDNVGTMNVVAIKRISPSTVKAEMAGSVVENVWVKSVSKEVMLTDFDAWGAPVKALLSSIQNPQRWSLYDHLAAPTYVKGRVALLGDSAHATTPHQGQGAGMAFEDSLILSEILGNILNATDGRDTEQFMKLEACLSAYDEIRRPRTKNITRTSREMGNIIEYAHEEIGHDLVKMKANLDSRMSWIWDRDLMGDVRTGIEIAKRLLGTSKEEI